MPHGLADGLGVKPVAVFAVPVLIGRRKRPVLSIGRKAVGRRAYARAVHKKRAVRPQIGTASVRGKGKIMIEANAHAGPARVLLNGGELFIDQPLQPAMEHDIAAMPVREIAYRLAGGVAVLLRPVGPDPKVRVAGMKMFIERAIDGEQPQQFALLLDPLHAVRARRMRFVDAVERAPFQGRHLLVFDEFGAAQTLDLRDFIPWRIPVNGLNIQIDEIAVEDAVRKVRAGVVRSPVMQRVQRVKRDEIGVQ